MTSGEGVMPPSSRSERRKANRVGQYSTDQRRKRDSMTGADFLPNHSPTSDQQNVIELLLSKSWRLFRISPMWQLDTTDSKLGSYSQQLTSYLMAKPSLESGYTGEVVALPRFGLDGSTALQINIQARNSQKDSTEAVIIICRVKPPRFSPIQGFMFLPLLLSQGPLKLVDPVLVWLASTFDCFVSPFTFTQPELLMLAIHYANSEPQGNSKGTVELVYSPPAAVKTAGLSTVAVELPRDSVETMFRVADAKVKGEDGSTGKVKELFIEMVCDVVSRGTGMKLKCFTLTRISTPSLHADASGLLKFLSYDVPIPVLATLQASWTNT